MMPCRPQTIVAWRLRHPGVMSLDAVLYLISQVCSLGHLEPDGQPMISSSSNLAGQGEMRLQVYQPTTCGYVVVRNLPESATLQVICLCYDMDTAACEQFFRKIGAVAGSLKHVLYPERG